MRMRWTFDIYSTKERTHPHVREVTMRFAEALRVATRCQLSGIRIYSNARHGTHTPDALDDTRSMRNQEGLSKGRKR
jgi:hypothetical protein